MITGIERNNTQNFYILDVLFHLYWQSKQREDLTIFKELPLFPCINRKFKIITTKGRIKATKESFN